VPIQLCYWQLSDEILNPAIFITVLIYTLLAIICPLLQGVFNGTDGFLLTDPVIHSAELKQGKKPDDNGTCVSNGKTDKGAQGISLFFETHKCNALCHRLGLYLPQSDTRAGEMESRLKHEFQLPPILQPIYKLNIPASSFHD
jgi:hypothetical protein